MSGTAPPPRAVLAAFGASDAPRPLAGGQTTAWRAGELVLKPQADAAFQQWLGTEVAALSRDGFRLAEAVPTRGGDWLRGGWSATRWVAGEPADRAAPPRWLDIVEAGRAFHRALAAISKPAFLDDRDDWWAVADRLAWADDEPEVIADLAPVVTRLRAATAPLGRAQVVHADLTGNVLVADGLPPAVIDVSPYWRPPAYAEGVVVADALCRRAASASLASELGVPISAVARALLFRVLTTNARCRDGLDHDSLHEHARRYAYAVEQLGL